MWRMIILTFTLTTRGILRMTDSVIASEIMTDFTGNDHAPITLEVRL
jgi:exonuclease III